MKSFRKINLNTNVKFEEIERIINDFKSVYEGINLLDNYNHRTYRIKLKVQELWPDFNLMPGRNKADVKVPSLNLNNVEVKTMNIKGNKINNLTFFKKGYMFDKQDRPGRREYILTIDGLVFGLFFNESLYWIFWTNDEKAMMEYRNLCKIKQEIFKTKFEETQKKKGNNGGYDTITIAISEFSDETTWNFYIENTIYQNITINEVKKLLKIEN